MIAKETYEHMRQLTFELHRQASELLAAFSMNDMADAREMEMLKKIPK